MTGKSVIDFYNGVFVPRMKSYVLEFKSLSEQEVGVLKLMCEMGPLSWATWGINLLCISGSNVIRANSNGCSPP
jgi:hypothetical protein